MSRVFFFDTSALIHRYLDCPSSRKIRTIVSRRDTKCFVGELTVLEMSSAIARRLRKPRHDPNIIDLVNNRKFDRLESRFFRDISQDIIEVYPLSNTHYTRARGLLRYAGVVKNRAITTVDALIASAALDLAYKEKERINFCTSDRPLFKIISGINAFTSALNLRFYDPPLPPAPPPVAPTGVIAGP